MHRDQPLVADRQAPIARQPRQRALHDPAVPPQPLRRVDPATRNAVCDPAPPTGGATAPIVIALIPVQLGRAVARTPRSTSPQGRDRVDQGLEQPGVMYVRGGHRDRERDAVPVRNKMVLRARFAFIRRIRAGSPPPFFAGRLRESTTARLQSSWPASASCCKSTWCKRFHTPRRCHSRSRRQQVMPDPQPIAWGKYSQGMPVLSTKRIPPSTARSGMRGRPPRRRGRALGNNGSRCAHNVSGTNGFIPESYSRHAPPERGFERHS
jgi:hypothetical protein